jgi:hypothetical protein
VWRQGVASADGLVEPLGLVEPAVVLVSELAAASLVVSD